MSGIDPMDTVNLEGLAEMVGQIDMDIIEKETRMADIKKMMVNGRAEMVDVYEYSVIEEQLKGLYLRYKGLTGTSYEEVR